MPPRKFDIHQHLKVESVHHEGNQVRVEVQDATGATRWINFRFTDVEAASQHASTVDDWRVAGKRLTYVRGEATGALLDDEELFRAAFADQPPTLY
ncbi:MAG TPA: hypothetical protein VF183_09540 [Acidimicrobiales bacterium]